MSTARTVAVFAIVIGCFAVLYPRIFHPTVLRIFGMQGKSGSDSNARNPNHPHDGRAGVKRPIEVEDIKSHIRPGPHPGLRAAAEMRQQQQQQGGTGRGMMGVVLPMYAVGIVLYLVYTIVKVFSKRQEVRNESAPAASNFGRSNYEEREERFTFGDDFDLDEDYKAFMNKKEKQKELEKLLLKADERHITEFEMRQLQRRLEETEVQMSRILQAMQTVTDKVESTVQPEEGVRSPDDKTGSSSQKPTSTQQEDKLKVPKEGEQNQFHGEGKSSDSSPDTDSFEVVSKTESSSFSVLSTPTDEDIPEMATTPASKDQHNISENMDTVPENVNSEPNQPLDDEDITVLSPPMEEKSHPVENIGLDEDILLHEQRESEEPSSVRQRKRNECGDQ